MTIDAFIFMVFVFAVCCGGFVYSLYLLAKKK